MVSVEIADLKLSHGSLPISKGIVASNRHYPIHRSCGYWDRPATARQRAGTQLSRQLALSRSLCQFHGSAFIAGFMLNAGEAARAIGRGKGIGASDSHRLYRDAGIDHAADAD
jgi:hypothetical protein